VLLLRRMSKLQETEEPTEEGAKKAETPPQAPTLAEQIAWGIEQECNCWDCQDKR
jgi:hypothetical protein